MIGYHIIFTFYNKDLTIGGIKTIPADEFSTENFAEEILQAVNKYAPKTKRYAGHCTVVEGWNTLDKGRKDT